LRPTRPIAFFLASAMLEKDLSEMEPLSILLNQPLELGAAVLGR
jgi:hypothetical protein